MIRAIIVDDEIHCMERLQRLLEEHYAGTVAVEGQYHAVNDAYNAILSAKPDLVFLDIQLKEESGFDLLKRFREIPFKVIFTTAHAQYAIQAFKFSAVDYLLKPIVTGDLIPAVDKIIDGHSKNDMLKRLEALFFNLQYQQAALRKISIPTQEGLEFVEVSEIVRCQADVNYTVIHLQSGRTIVVSRTLKEFETLLEDSNFFRLHHSHLVNLHYVKKYHKGKGGYVTLHDNTELDVSVRRKEALLKRMRPQP